MTEAERLIEEWQRADAERNAKAKWGRIDPAVDRAEAALRAYRPAPPEPAPQTETRVEECHHTRWLNSIGSPSVCLECGATFDDKRGWIVPLRREPRVKHPFVALTPEQVAEEMTWIDPNEGGGYDPDWHLRCRRPGCGLRREAPVHTKGGRP